MNDHELCEPYRWADSTGRVRWQPRLGNEKLWKYGTLRQWQRTSNHWWDPKLYRWKWMARRKALKKLKQQRRKFKPAKKDEVLEPDREPERDPEEVRREFLRLVGHEPDGRLKSWVKKVLT